MPSTVLSAATLGIDAYPVHVEVDTDRSLPTFTVVGQPDSTVRESKERVLAAIKNAGYQWPRRRIVAKKARPSTCLSPWGPRRLEADQARAPGRLRTTGRTFTQRQCAPGTWHAGDPFVRSAGSGLRVMDGRLAAARSGHH